MPNILPPRAESYIRHNHSKGRSTEAIVERWNLGYPDSQITAEEVRAVIAAKKAVPKKAFPKKKEAKKK